MTGKDKFQLKVSPFWLRNRHILQARTWPAPLVGRVSARGVARVVRRLRGDRAPGNREASYRWRGHKRRPRGQNAADTRVREGCVPGSARNLRADLPR